MEGVLAQYGCRRIIQVDAAHWWWLKRPPLLCKAFWVPRKALYKCNKLLLFIINHLIIHPIIITHPFFTLHFFLQCTFCETCFFLRISQNSSEPNIPYYHRYDHTTAYCIYFPHVHYLLLFQQGDLWIQPITCVLELQDFFLRAHWRSHHSLLNLWQTTDCSPHIHINHNLISDVCYQLCYTASIMRVL